jgi:hypothetical protein
LLAFFLAFAPNPLASKRQQVEAGFQESRLKYSARPLGIIVRRCGWPGNWSFAAGELSMRINMICPVQSHLQKYSFRRFTQIKTINRAVSSHRGRLAIVTNAGRDAVDANGAFDEQHVRRTAKSCGPDASTLASSLRKQFR